MTPLQLAPETQYFAVVQREGLREGGEPPFFPLFSGHFFRLLLIAMSPAPCHFRFDIRVTWPGGRQITSQRRNPPPSSTPTLPLQCDFCRERTWGRAEIVCNYEAELCPCTVNAFSGSACVCMQAKYSKYWVVPHCSLSSLKFPTEPPPPPPTHTHTPPSAMRSDNTVLPTPWIMT